MDQSQPQWTPPPQQPMGWGTPGYGGPPVRPTGVTLAAIYLIVMGVLLALAGAACGLLGAGVSGINSGTANGNPFAVFGGAIAVFGIIVLVLGILAIASGAGALSGKNWGRVLGIIISILFAILLILSGLGGLTNSQGFGSGIVSLVLGVLFALSAWALIQAGPFFSYRR